MCDAIFRGEGGAIIVSAFFPVLSQVENLTTYPAVRSKLRAQKIFIYAWVYEIETGKIFAFNATEGKFVPLEEEGFPVPNLMAQGRFCDIVDRPSQI